MLPFPMMGNQMRYLSKPVTDCYFEIGAGKTCIYTAASMQGWRKCQEDRFICIPDFYEGCSFFAIYDGHGGSEIAEFLRRRLHSEILDSLRTEGDIELALHLGFLSCDASIMEPENIAELNDMIEEENRGAALKILKNQQSLDAVMSQAGEDQASAGPSASSTRPSASSTRPSASSTRPSAPSTRPSDPSTRPSDPSTRPSDPSTRPSDPSTTTTAATAPLFPFPMVLGSSFSNEVRPSGSRVMVHRMEDIPVPNPRRFSGGMMVIQRLDDYPVRREEPMEVQQPLNYLLSDDIEPSDPDDEDFSISTAEESSSTESEEETNNISAEEFLNAEPGYLSGSTATVAIIQENRIHVANVGDSRCVLSRKGQAIDMSLDHKPDDPEERARIIGAGGSVSEDGRVDNCLNLSRAFGDFKFKGDSFVPSQQCITAEPFIKSIDIDEEDDFLIIASDGLWNSVSSQEVVDYINIRLKAGDCNLQDICEEMFKFTLATDKDNDGTGCDNMCCIIIKFGNKAASSFIRKTCVTLMSTDDAFEQEGKNENAPSRAEGRNANAPSRADMDEGEWISSDTSDENKSQDSHLSAECPNQSMQHVMHHLKQKEALNLENNLEFRVSTLDGMTCCKMDQVLGEPLKLAYLGDLRHFKNTQLEEAFPGFKINNGGNSANNKHKICLPISDEYFFNNCASKIFNTGHRIKIEC